MNEPDLEALEAEADALAQRLEGLFEATGQRMAAEMEAAARSGELSFERMRDTILADLARLAADELLSRLLNGAGAEFAPTGLSEWARPLARAVRRGSRFL
ncbi:phage tail tape measure C-terminal domain-containing protein [Maricaulis sp. D1M11]|uniref:phage tail tape measure C-terminal domain-containing protein n=1 Tax=Maricaulis sp. D1M11 TaxID=3076117 RepID=UPI0039B386D1